MASTKQERIAARKAKTEARKKKQKDILDSIGGYFKRKSSERSASAAERKKKIQERAAARKKAIQAKTAERKARIASKTAASKKSVAKKTVAKKPVAKKTTTKTYQPSAVAAGYKPAEKKKVKSGDLMAATSGTKKAAAKPKPKAKAPAKKATAFGSGSSKTVTRNGKKLANVSKEQLSRSGLSLRGYMNAWNKSGKRPTAKKAVKSKTLGPIKSTPKKLKQLKRKN